MRKTPPLFPFLVAVYPALAFYAHNIEQTGWNAALRPLALSLATAFGLVLGMGILFRDFSKAGLATAFLLGSFFTYGHVYNFLEGVSLLGVVLGRHRLLAPVWFLITFLGVLWAVRSKKDRTALVGSLNLIAGLILLMPLGQIGWYQWTTRPGEHRVHPSKTALESGIPLPYGKPDIYYIILDSYTRDDMLKKYYDLDNTPFLDQLLHMGFKVARCAQSNFSQTELSLSSSLNYDYLDHLGEEFNPSNNRRAGLVALIQDSAVRRNLEVLGYRIVALDTGYEPTRWRDADVYLAAPVSAEINDFEETFLRTTAARLIMEGVTTLHLPPDWEKRDQAHRARILYQLEQMKAIPNLPGPKFVFAHFITPHWPYIFGPSGEAVHERPESDKGYHDQVLFINQQIIPILQNILDRSQTPPVIVIQGDHGAVLVDPERRMAILNAYYLPDGGNALVREDTSPVNTFRLIFQYYFGLDTPPVENISNYSRYESPYEYQIVENTRPGCP